MTASFHLESPPLEPTAWVAPGAVLLGDVRLGPEASLWYGAVVRGDTEAIRIGARSNIQDGSVVHADPGFPCLVGDNVTVGHRAVLHGCRIGDGALVGMGAIVMNGAEIGPESLVAAGALVPEGRKYPARSLLIGSPAKAVRTLTDEDAARLRESAAHYVAAAAAHREHWQR